MPELLDYAYLGFAAGAVLDFATALERAVGNKYLAFILDFLLTVLFSAVLGCLMLASSGGRFHWYYFFLTVAAFLLYLLILHRFMYPLWKTVFSPLQKVRKKLKFRKKS